MIEATDSHWEFTASLLVKIVPAGHCVCAHLTAHVPVGKCDAAFLLGVHVYNAMSHGNALALLVRLLLSALVP